MTSKNKKAPKKKAKKIAPIIMWAVIDNEYPDDPVTFTATRDEAVMALDQYIYLKNYAHFRRWCPLHDRPIDHAESWAEYCRTVLRDDFLSNDPTKPRYVLAKLDYQPNVIASLLRTMNNCIPMGLPFDTDEEIDAEGDRFSEKVLAVEAGTAVFTPLEEGLKYLFDDMEEGLLDDGDCENCDDINCPSHPDHRKRGKGDRTYDA